MVGRLLSFKVMLFSGTIVSSRKFPSRLESKAQQAVTNPYQAASTRKRPLDFKGFSSSDGVGG